MSIHDKMNSDYVWVRHAPVEEGLKVRYFHNDKLEITATTSSTTEHQIELKDWR